MAALELSRPPSKCLVVGFIHLVALRRPRGPKMGPRAQIVNVGFVFVEWELGSVKRMHFALDTHENFYSS